MRLSARLDSDGSRTVRCARRPTGCRSTSPSTRWRPGSTRSSGRSTSATPALWWPRSLGDQPLTDDRRRGLRRRRAERRRRAAHRFPRGGVERLDLLGQRRADVPQRRQPAARPVPASPTRPRRRARRPRARRRGRARRTARARPHRRPQPVRRRRRDGRAAAPGLPAAVGVRPLGAARRRSARRPRRSTCSATTHRSCSGPRTTTRPRRRSGLEGDTARRAVCATSSASSCRRGTSRCSIGG